MLLGDKKASLNPSVRRRVTALHTASGRQASLRRRHIHAHSPSPRTLLPRDTAAAGTPVLP